jgi:hypothetical protein
VSSLALLDVDQDGRLDVVVAGTDGLEVLRQNSGGGLVSAGPIPTAPVSAGFVQARDMDGDSDLDLIVASASGISLLTHGSGSTFTASPVSADGTGELDTGDIDGDGRIDVAAVGNQLVDVYHNTTGGWTRTQHPALLGYWPTLSGVEVADVTGDGRADITVTNGGNGSRINVFQQNTNGTLAGPVVYPSYQIGETIDAADVDGDGRNDVVVGNSAWGAVSLLRQQADGTLAPYQVFGADIAQHPFQQGLVLADIDGDGKTDIITAGDTNIGILRHFDAPLPTDAQEFIRSTSVADFASGQSLAVAPTITFQVGLDPSTVTADTVRLVDGRDGTTVPATLAYNAGSKTVTITPSAPLGDNKPYRIVVDGVHDAGGHPQPWPYTLTFRTVDAAPTALAGFSVQGLTGAVRLGWSIPGDLDQVIVRMAQGTTPPNSPTAGTAAYTGVESDVTVGGLTPGTTYSFAAFYKDRSGQTSPPRTATLFGTALSMEAAGSSTVSTASTLTFGSTLTRVDPAGPVVGQPVELRVTCRGRLSDEPVATVTTSGSGTVSADTHQLVANCSYRWVLAGSSTFMGASSDAVEVTATIAMPPGGPPNRRG